MQRAKSTVGYLSYFVALAEAGSLTRAAERMMEPILGAPMFERGGPTILAPLGCKLLERAREIAGGKRRPRRARLQVTLI